MSRWRLWNVVLKGWRRGWHGGPKGTGGHRPTRPFRFPLPITNNRLANLAWLCNARERASWIVCGQKSLSDIRGRMKHESRVGLVSTTDLKSVVQDLNTSAWLPAVH
jgi:hypothetical protein